MRPPPDPPLPPWPPPEEPPEEEPPPEDPPEEPPPDDEPPEEEPPPEEPDDEPPPDDEPLDIGAPPDDCGAAWGAAGDGVGAEACVVVVVLWCGFFFFGLGFFGVVAVVVTGGVEATWEEVEELDPQPATATAAAMARTRAFFMRRDSWRGLEGRPPRG